MGIIIVRLRWIFHSEDVGMHKMSRTPKAADKEGQESHKTERQTARETFIKSEKVTQEILELF